jgi:hypothetical protein
MEGSGGFGKGNRGRLERSESRIQNPDQRSEIRGKRQEARGKTGLVRKGAIMEKRSGLPSKEHRRFLGRLNP